MVVPPFILWANWAHEAKLSRTPCHLAFLCVQTWLYPKSFKKKKSYKSEAAFYFMEESIALGNRFVFNDS